MRVYVCLAGLLLAFLGAPWHPANASAAVDITGTWELEMAFPNAGVVQMVMGDMQLTQAGSKITGSVNGRPVKGTFDGTNIIFTINFQASIPEGIDVTYKGKLVDDKTLKGNVTFPQYGSGTWTANRK
jgi:hypothetical protein